MTNKEAIEILKTIQRDIMPNDELSGQRTEDIAFDLAIKALNTMPFIQDMDNTIDTLKARIKALEQAEKSKSSSLFLTKEMKDNLFSIMRTYNFSSSDACRLIGCGYNDWKLAVDGERPFYKGWVKKIKKHLNIEYDLFGGTEE